MTPLVLKLGGSIFPNLGIVLQDCPIAGTVGSESDNVRYHQLYILLKRGIARLKQDGNTADIDHISPEGSQIWLRRGKAMLSFIEDCWTRIKIAFDVQDPIQPTGKLFKMPQSFHELDPQIKKTLTICNLFASNDQSVEEIAEYFQVPRSQVVRILIEEAFLKEQRKRHPRAMPDGRRQMDRANELAEIGPLHTSLS